ncbi:MAG: hypothetical protein ABSF09_12450 [Candidatus Bathyarchaeia archaeon]|jgi:hypothetical protein
MVREYSKICNVLLLIMFALIIATSVSAADGVVELAHDQGKLSSTLYQSNLGHMVRFTPPQTPWAIQTVRIYGRYFGNIEKQNFVVEIWAANGTTLSSQTYSYDKFNNIFGWTDIQTSAVVTGDFQVVVFTGSSSSTGIFVGYDSSSVNQYSDFVQTNHATFTHWPIKRPDGVTIKKDDVNWMIRAVGGAPGTFTTSSKPLTTARTSSSASTLATTKTDSSPFAGFLDMSRLQQIGGVAATGAAAIFGWFFKTRSRRFIGSYLNKIDLTYNQYAVNRVECKKQLQKMKEEIVQLLKKGKLDETQFALLDSKLSEHLKDLV